MSDISSTGEGRAASLERRNYEKQKRELKDQYEEEVRDLKEGYDQKISKERQEGEAAINHIKKNTNDKIRQAEQVAGEEDKALDVQISRKQDNLKKSEVQREAYIEQAKLKHAQWIKSQEEELSRQKLRTEEQTEKQMSDTLSRNQERVKRVNDRVRNDEQEIKDKGDENIKDLRHEYTQKSEAIQDKEQKHLATLRESHVKRVDEENKTFKTALHKENDEHSKEMKHIQDQHVEEHDKIKTNSDKSLKEEHKRTEVQLANSRKTGQEQIHHEDERYKVAHKQQTDEHEQTMKKTDARDKKEMEKMKHEHEKNVKREKTEFNRQETELVQRHDEQRHKKIDANQKDLENVQKVHDDRIKGQEIAFEKRYDANEVASENTYSNQALMLGRELLNQKLKFIKAADKYNKPERDPFYQIRDNKTQLHETSDAYIFEAKVPPHEKDDVWVRVKQDRLTFSGNRSFEDQIKDDNRTMKTHNVQTFQEHYDLPKKIREDDVVKEYNDGVLRVYIPKVT